MHDQLLNKNSNLVGQLLVAPPAQKHDFWAKTVILIIEHDHTGSVGLIINKRSDLTLLEFGNQIDINLNLPQQLYIGGPIGNRNLSMLHSSEWRCDNTLKINDQVSLSSSHRMLKRMVKGDRPRNWRILLGICAWSPGQLIAELSGPRSRSMLADTSWCVSSCNEQLVFKKDGEQQWRSTIDQAAKDFAKNFFYEI